MTIERAWVRALLSTTGRAVGTVAGLFGLIVVAPIVLAIVGLPLVALLVFLAGVAAAAVLVLALLPGRGRRS
ncbi:MAG TPA: hypothetical protein VG455_16950 [Acidimicrobiales bacterium]|nr:hypothetical protein [Acidimicrobiales bacterium]